jgi:transketolase
VLPWVDVATGSLGQGLPDGVGVALAGKFLERLPYRVWVLCGDSELAERSIWEALDEASYDQLSNLITIVDVNRLGQRGETALGWNLDAYARRAEAFGSRVLVIDGHDLAAIDDALRLAGEAAPTVILARTVKGLLRGRGQPRLARQTLPAGHGRAGDRRDRRRPQPGAARTAARWRSCNGRPRGARLS